MFYEGELLKRSKSYINGNILIHTSCTQFRKNIKYGSQIEMNLNEVNYKKYITLNVNMKQYIKTHSYRIHTKNNKKIKFEEI